MEYKLVKYNSREEMIAAYRKMKPRKKEWIAEQQRDFQRIRDSINAEAMAYGNA